MLTTHAVGSATMPPIVYCLFVFRVVDFFKSTINYMGYVDRPWLLGNLASKRLSGAQKGLRERIRDRGVCHSSTREGQQEPNRVLLVFSTYLYKEKY